MMNTETGEPLGLAFRPNVTPRDKRDLSVDDGSLISAQESFEKHTTKVNATTGENLKSGGVWSVTKQEAEDQGTVVDPSPIEADPSNNVLENLAHVDIKYSASLSKTEMRAVSNNLLTAALARGCRYSA